MKTIFLIISLSLNLFAQNDLLLLFGGARVYSANLITNSINGTMEIGSTVYTSNFSVNTDSWAGTRVTTTGNIDGISDGTTSKDNTLRNYASADNNSHFFAKTFSTTANKGYIYKFYYLIPVNTNVVKFNISNFVGSELGAGSTDVFTTVGTWTIGKYSFLPTTTPSVRFQMATAGSYTFIGANLVTDDLVYIHDCTVTETQAFIKVGNHYQDTSSVYTHGGSLSMKIVSSAAGNTNNCLSLAAVNYTTLVSGTKYQLKFYVRSATATTTITYLIGDKTGTSANISTTGFDELIFEFTATASTVNQPLKLYLSKAATVYIDDLTLRSYAE